MNGGVSLDHFGSRGSSLRIDDFSVQSLGTDSESAEKTAAIDRALAANESVDTPPEKHPEVERLETLARIERCFVSIDEKYCASQERAFRQLSDRVADSVGKLLPHLVDAFGSAEIAASVVAIVEKSRQGSPILDVSPEDHDEIVGHLENLCSPLQVKVRKSPDTTPGTAALRWGGGGADIDLNAFLQTARRHLERADSQPSTGVE